MYDSFFFVTASIDNFYTLLIKMHAFLCSSLPIHFENKWKAFDFLGVLISLSLQQPGQQQQVGAAGPGAGGNLSDMMNQDPAAAVAMAAAQQQQPGRIDIWHGELGGTF